MIVAATLFFRGAAGGDELPFLNEYLLSLDGHGTWQELQAMPAPVVRYWLLYRNARIDTQNAANAAASS